MPEDIKTDMLSADEQMAALHAELAGHPVFRRLRGGLGRSLDDILENRRKGLNPTQAREDMREFGADLAWAQGVLARLHRDGRLVAEYELRRALASSWHAMLGETTPVEKTVPITFVMYRPDGLLPFLSWLMAWEHRDDDFRHAAAEAKNGDPGIMALFNAFPEIEESFRDVSVMSSEGLWKLLDEYRRVAIKEIIRIYKRVSPEMAPPWKLCDCAILCPLDGRHGGPYRRAVLGWAFRCSQRQLLGAIPRSKQRYFATWQIDLPSVYDHQFDGFGGSGMGLGFHPESEHELWRHRYPAFVSHGVQHGHGAIVMPHSLHGYVHDREEETYVRYSFLGSPVG